MNSTLELERAGHQAEVKRLNDRIRELEEVATYWQTRFKELDDRIQKAREILEKAYRYEEYPNDGVAIKAVLEALEGK